MPELVEHERHPKKVVFCWLMDLLSHCGQNLISIGVADFRILQIGQLVLDISFNMVFATLNIELD
jgi:hypothetical protein